MAARRSAWSGSSRSCQRPSGARRAAEGLMSARHPGADLLDHRGQGAAAVGAQTLLRGQLGWRHELLAHAFEDVLIGVGYRWASGPGTQPDTQGGIVAGGLDK